MSDSVEHLSSVFLRLKKKPTRQLDDVRPKACREYPHSDRVKQHQLLSLHAMPCHAIEDIAKGLDASLSVKQTKGNRKGNRKGN